MGNDPNRPAGSRPVGPRIIPPEAFDQPQPGPRPRRFGGWLATAAVALIIIMGVRILWPGPADPEPPEEPMMKLAASDATPDRTGSEHPDSVDRSSEGVASAAGADTATESVPQDAAEAVAEDEAAEAVTEDEAAGSDPQTGTAERDTDAAPAEEAASEDPETAPDPAPARVPPSVRESLDHRLAQAGLLLEIGRYVEAVEELLQLRDRAAEIGENYASDPTALAIRSRADSALAAARAACRDAVAEACP